jgi:RNA polymerase sigma factor (sigma-70 family)
MGFTGVGSDKSERVHAAMPPDVTVLFQDLGPRLRSLAVAITFDRSIAEEVVQDAFLGLLRRDDAVRDPAGYLHRSVINGAVDRVRRRRRFRSLPQRRSREVIGPEIDEVWPVVAQLPPHQRAIVALRFYDDQSYEQIAETLGIPIGSVKSGLHRALSKLKEQL